MPGPGVPPEPASRASRLVSWGMDPKDSGAFKTRTLRDARVRSERAPSLDRALAASLIANTADRVPWTEELAADVRPALGVSTSVRMPAPTMAHFVVQRHGIGVEVGTRTGSNRPLIAGALRSTPPRRPANRADHPTAGNHELPTWARRSTEPRFENARRVSRCTASRSDLEASSAEPAASCALRAGRSARSS